MTELALREGTHRTASLEQTKAKIWPLLRPMGITRVANVTGLDCIGIPVAAAYRPNARSLSVAQGKGSTLLAAEVSAAMESIESYHAEHVVRPLVHASFNQLRYSFDLVDPSTLPRGPLDRFSLDLKIHWIEGFDLVQNCRAWVPYELVHTDFTLPLPADAGCFALSSNGLASGNHVLEAAAHGACELIERDSEAVFACSGASERARRVLDLASVDAEECRALLARFEAANVRVTAWSITSAIGVPAFRVSIMDDALDPARPLRPSIGLGCHPSRRIALGRALTEAAQARLTLISGSRDDLAPERYAPMSDLATLASMRERELVTAGAALSFSDVPTSEGFTIEDDFASVRERLVAAGFEHMILVDLTKPEFGVPVVRMIVPGLETSRELPGWRPGPRSVAALRGES